MSLLAGVFSKHGVKKGDRVLIYMPMIPQAIAAMLASGIAFYKNSNPLRSYHITYKILKQESVLFILLSLAVSLRKSCLFESTTQKYVVMRKKV